MAVIFLSDGLYISPMPFVWARIFPFSRKDRGEEPALSRAMASQTERGFLQSLDLESEKRERECSALSVYQMGCLVQQLTVGVQDIGAGPGCSCERSGDHCINRLR